VIISRSGKARPALFGRLAERGDWRPLLISLALLLGIGLWMTAPAFGRPPREDARPGKPIRERFLSEALFLKRYAALGLYQDAYKKAMRARLLSRDGLEPETDQALVARLAELTGIGEKELRAALLPWGKISGAEFARRLKTIEKVMERI
jgi:hypothetical protein